MISGKKAVAGAILLVVLTTILNVTVGNFIAVKINDKYIISRESYEYYQQIQDEYGKLFQLRDYLLQNYYQELDDQVLVEGAINGMFDSIGDPYTDYMTEKEFNDLIVRTSGTYGGIGVIVTPGEDGYVTVVSPIRDTPGERAGLITGDKILTVDGEAVYGDKLDYAVSIMKGDPNTQVVLGIRREGRNDVFEVSITREMIRIKTVESEVLADQIGYLSISTFDERTASEFKEHLKQLEAKGIQGLVLDLRNNPGGLLSQCVQIADILLGEQTIVYTEDRQGRREVEKSDKNKVDYPLVVLVNQGSASASEILAGAVKDGGQGTIVGTTTFGKALVQMIRPLEDGTGFKYTSAQYYTPNGTYIQGVGIEPNVVVELPEELQGQLTIPRDQDSQLQKAIELVKEAMGQ